MDRIDANNIVLCGKIAGERCYSHEAFGESYFILPLEVKRLSGTCDVINLMCAESVFEDYVPCMCDAVCVTGEVRSFNNRSGIGNRLVITVFVQNIKKEDAQCQNTVELEGALCREPIYRKTPFGREICDVMLAVNRRYGRVDYLPCVIWGRNARRAAHLLVGSRIRLHGRLQSRTYTKVIDGCEMEKTAFEISVSEFCVCE